MAVAGRRKFKVPYTTTTLFKFSNEYLNDLQEKTYYTKAFIMHEALILFEEAYKKNKEFYDKRQAYFLGATRVGEEEAKKVFDIIL